MKRFLLVLGAMVTGATTLYAQGNFTQSTPQQRADRMTTSMQKQITGLSSGQVDTLKTLNLGFSQQMDSMFQANQGDRTAMRTQMQAINASRDSTLKTVLTDDQFKQWQAYEAKQRSRMRQGTNGGGGGDNGGGGGGGDNGGGGGGGI